MTSLEDDNQYVRVATQIPTQSYDSLELPYVYQGVGRSNNYLEQFNSAYSINGRLDNIKIFTPIIPNSQLRILANSLSKEDWELELFINPAQILLVTVICISAVLFVTGIVIIYMHIQEKR